MLKPFRLLAGVLLLCVLAPLAGCQHTKAAYKAADDPGEYAYVLTEHYASLVHEAAELRNKPSTPTAAINAMQKADNAAFPVIERLRSLRGAYVQVRDAKTEAELQAATDEAVRVLADLIRAVAEARGRPLTQLEDEILYRAKLERRFAV